MEILTDTDKSNSKALVIPYKTIAFQMGSPVILDDKSAVISSGNKTVPDSSKGKD